MKLRNLLRADDASGRVCGSKLQQGEEVQVVKLSILVACAAVATLVGCTTYTPAGTAVLSMKPMLAGGTYTSPGGLSFAADIREIDGKTGVCGVWAESDRQSVLTKGRAINVLGRGAIVLDGQAIVSGLAFLRKVAPARSYGGLDANCVVTDRPWSPADASLPSQIVVPRQIVYNDSDGEYGAIIYYRPGVPSAHPDDPKPWQ